MYLLDQWKTPAEAETGLNAMLARKELVMGFGHRVYKTCDPRNAIIKAASKKLSQVRMRWILSTGGEYVAIAKS